MTQYIKKLPAVFQTVTERKFFDATFDQVFSKKDSDYLAGYLGRRIPGRYNPVNDFYLPEPSKNRTWWQLEATAFAREADSTKSNIFFYDDLLERIEYYGGNTLNQDRLFESEYYSFGPPIDYDMFINYQNYYWVEQGLPTINISNIDIGAYPTLDAYIEGEIIGKATYTTQPTAIPPNLTFTTGLTVSFTGSVDYAEPRFVENFGDCIGIKLVQQFPDFTSGTIFELLPWDGVIELANGRLISNLYWDATTWETQTQPSSGDYITIERGALDRNAWSRTNKWFHIDAINLTMQITGDAFPANATRALRPIIQFIADLTLFKSGTQFRDEIQYGFRDDALGDPLRLIDLQGDQLSAINSTYGIAMGDGDLVVFMNDDTPVVANFYPWDTTNWDILPFVEWDAGDLTAFNHYIFQVNVQPDGSVNFAPYTSWATPVLEGDIIFITEDAPFNGAQRGSTWYYSLGVWQQAFNDKVSLNQPPLFQLYDHNGVELNDAVTYPESTFNGSEIFSYKVNTEPGATVDPVLKFPIVYTSLGQASDIVFQNDLIVERYTYGAAKLDIDGYYYYKTTQESILYNNWNLYNVCGCGTGISPNFEAYVSTSSQTIFNTIIPTVANAAGKTYLQVFVNGVYQLEGVTEAYQVTGANQITFNTGQVLNSDVVIYFYTVPTDTPDFEEFIASAAQTVFNTAIPTVAISAGKSYLEVYVNGVFQIESVTKNYQVTGPNQITFNSGLALNDDVVILGYSTVENPPNYGTSIATSGQTLFSTVFATLPGTINGSSLEVYVNGVYQLEGATKNYQITGPNQITFNSALVLNDDVAIYGVAQPVQDFCPNYSKQRVIDKFVVGYGSEFNFRLSVTPYGYVFGGGAIQPSADINVNVNGLEIKNESGGFEFFELNNRIYIDLTAYLTSLLTTTQPIPPVVEAQTYTRGLLDPTYPGYFEIPQQLEANPNQLEVGEISASNLTEHFASIIANQEGFTGIAFGGDNNYRDTKKNRSVGEFILQNVAPLLKTMLVSSSNDLDFIIGERFSQDEYTKFKNKYLQTALQLINTGFNPVQYYNNTIVVSAWVEEILKIVNISKEFSDAFAYSYMIANGSPFANESTIVPIGGLITLTNYVDLSDPKNALYIYDVTGVEQILVIGEDYEIASTNLAIDIQFNTINVPVGTPVFVALYKNPLPAYIPSTPTKIGAYQTYVPRIELDTTYITPTNVIIGHDGSKTIAYNDYRDNLLLELEIRIYNLLQYKFRNQYYLPLRVESVKSGYFRQTRYSRNEFLDITDSYLNKWSAKNRANYRTNDWPSASTQPGVVPDPYTGNIWKLYNYRDAVDAFDQPIDIPGNWKGIFQYYYDTYYPDTRPWEMLGFGAQPNWWQYEYGAPVLNGAGQEVWTSTATGNNVMWADLEDGIIRQGPSAIYDPLTLIVQPQEIWARPGLSTVIPVDTAGEIISVMTLFNVAYSGNPYAPFDTFEQDWIYGDGAPVEQAWMSTSAYAFMVQEFLYLMRPAPYGELMFDTVGTELSPGMITVPTSVEPVRSNFNWQYVQNDTYTNDDAFFAWMRPKNKDQIVHAEIVDGVVQIRYGYQRWISDRILLLGKNVASTFGQKIRTLDVNLANKLAGFTNKDTTNTYIESVTPGSTTSGLIIPSTNFEVILHKSPSVDTYSYSGVVIRALADGTFVVYGYDLLNSEFLVLDRSTAKLIDVSIGGTPAPFLHFTPGATYNPGDIVRYNGVFYVSLVTQTVQKFEASGYKKLKALPTVGGISATYKPISLTTITKIPYGSVLKTVQDVFDLLIGWGAYLESRGWKFNEVNQDTNQISDWLYSAKQFLFWLNTEWAPDSSIQVSPSANKAILEVSRGYPEDVETISNGVYSILDKFGVAIAPTGTTTDRDGVLISVEPANLASGGIYFLQVNATETEHILIFDNTTNFNDIVYSPLLRARQQRLRFNGFRSNGWYGKMEAPGYLIIEDQLVPNYDTIVDAMRYYYDPNTTIDNPSIEELGRHLIGYESKSYLDNLQVSNDVQYLFYRGAIRQKGTSQAFEKLFRSTKVQSDEIIQVFEEWALKLSDFGNTVEQVSTEFKLQPEQNTGEVIVARLNYVPSEIGFIRQISILNAENIYTSVPAIFIPPPDATPPVWITFDPLVVYTIGAVVRYDDPQGNPVYYSSNIAQGPGPFVAANWTEVLRTRNAKAYAVLDSIGRIARIDINDPGYGYLIAPLIGILSAEPTVLDSLYSVWQGAIISDPTLDNIINIDIDDTNVWTVRPNDPVYSLEFPVTNDIDYSLPNAGYVHFNDVNLSSFDVTQTAVRWGTSGFNPVENNILWVAKTFTEDWNVYKLIDITVPSVFDVFANPAGELFLRTDPTYLITPQLTLGVNDTDFGNMIILQVIEAHAIVSAIGVGGVITEITITKAGANYIFSPDIASFSGIGIGAALTTQVAGGVVSDVIIDNGGTGYSIGDEIIYNPPTSISGENNFAVGFAFNQVETTTDPTHNYYNLLTLDANPITVDEIPNYANFTKLMLFKTMRFQTTTEAIVPTYVSLGEKVWVDNIDLVQPLWTVYTKITPTLQYPNGLEPFRLQEDLINTSLFENASVFGIKTATELVQLPVYDPFKNILPGPAKQNITYTSMQDPARYNVTSNLRLLNENITFGKGQVGQLWWDLSFTRYVYYEQPIALDGSETEVDNLVYRRDHWGQIFPGSTVGIFEWVESPVPPAEYTGTGTPRDTTSYVQLVTSNRFTDVTEINYYFWVLNTTDRPNIENRTMAAVEVSRLLQTPKSQGFAFFSPIQQTSTNNSYMFYNVQEILAYQGDNVQIQYRLSERDDQEHAQWAFFREGDPGSIVTDQFWNKMVDSLCGYTKVLPLSDEFSNEIILYNDIPWDIYSWDTVVWDAEAYGIILPVPDPSLSDGEKYGIEYRPRQGMFVKLQAARKVFVQSSNDLLMHIAIRDDNPAWDINVTTDTYWDYTNWYAVGFENATPTVVFQTLLQANTALTGGQLVVGDIVQVTNGTIDGRFVLYNVVQLNPNIPVLSLEEVGIEKSAIKLLDTVYTTNNVYGLSVELRQLLNAFRTEVMVDEFLVDQNEVYFSMMNYVLSEQKNPDWLFKTSYIYIKENNQPLTQELLYTPDQIDDVIDYINDAKPYHTKIRDYTTTYVTSDIAPGIASDSYKINTILAFGPDNMDYVDPGHWDALCSDDTMPGPWDSYAWDVCPPQTYIVNAQTFIDNIDQFISREDVYTVPLTFFDISKVGYSQLFPYTFDFSSINLNDPQTFITPQDIVGVQIGTDILIYGQDYFVEYNVSDETYTIYFYNDPGVSPIPVALVWYDGGGMQHFRYNTVRNEVAYGFANDDLVVNVDTTLPVNDVSLIDLVPPFLIQPTIAPYVGWGDVWEGVDDPVVSQILIDAGGTNEIPWDTPLTLLMLDNTISSKENTNVTNGANFYRNADIFAGTLVTTLLAPTDITYNVQTIIVSATSNIFPDPIMSTPGVIWIEGERIEYKLKTPIALNTWELGLVRRGTMGTAATQHDAMVPEVDPTLVGPDGETILKNPVVLTPNKVWAERGNYMPVNSNIDVWSAIDSTGDPSTEIVPNEFTSVTSVPLGGLWYAQTPEATFLKQEQGTSIP